MKITMCLYGHGDKFTIGIEYDPVKHLIEDCEMTIITIASAYNLSVPFLRASTQLTPHTKFSMLIEIECAHENHIIESYVAERRTCYLNC